MLEYFTIATIATLLTHAYFAARFIPPLRARPRPRNAVTIALALNILLLPATLVATLRAPASIASLSVPIAHLAFADVGFCITLAFVLAVRDLGWLSWSAFERLRSPARRVDEDRRAALLNGLNATVGAIAAGSTLTGYAVALAQPVVRTERIALRGLRGDRPLRIAQVSDLHVGPTIRREYVAALVEAVNALGADVIVLTGDLVDGSVAQLRDQVAPLASLRAAKGVFVVTGNHEYFYGASEWIAWFNARQLRVIENDSHTIEHDGQQIALLGVHDEASDPRATDRRRMITLALDAAGPHDASVLLAHRPSDAPHAAALGIAAQLSGHIHAGQFVPLAWLVRRVEPYFAGHYRVGSMALYVNRGAGYWGPPNRLGARQEITLVEFVAA